MALKSLMGNGFESNLANSTANALSTGLDSLIESKTKKLQQQHDYQKKLTGLQALKIDNAEQLAHLDDQSLQYLIKNKIEEPSRQAYAQGLDALLGGQGNQPMQQQQAPNQQMDPEQYQRFAEFLKSPNAAEFNREHGITPEDIGSLDQFLANRNNQPEVPKPQLNEKQATELAKLGLKKRQLDSQEKRESLKETREFRNDVQRKRRAASKNLNVIKQMKEISDRGDINSPGYLKFLKTVGLDDVKSLLTPDSEAYQKLETFFLKNLRDIFGGRITQSEMYQYLRGIPTLMNSKEGRDKIFKDMELGFQAEILEAQELDKIMKENNGYAPDDLEGQLQERLEPKLDKLYSKMSFSGSTGNFVNDISDASKSGAKRIRDHETGKILVRKGDKWVEEK